MTQYSICQTFEQVMNDLHDIHAEQIEHLAENTPLLANDYADLFETLHYYYQNPIDLNHTNHEELSRLGLVSKRQQIALFKHIRLNGSLLELEELQSIPSFDITTIQLITPFVTIHPDECNSTNDQVRNRLNNRYFLRYQQILENQKGYAKNQLYLGSPFQLYSRYQFTLNKQIKLGITAEKDAGEEFFKGSQKNGLIFTLVMFGFNPNHQVISLL